MSSAPGLLPLLTLTSFTGIGRTARGGVTE